MRTNKLALAIQAATTAALLAMLLAGCAKPAADGSAPPAAAPDTPPAAPPADALPAPDTAPAAPVQPAPEAPPPTEPSAAPKPTASTEPSIESMALARPSAKLSVAVDLHYSFDGAVEPNQPVTLHLAAVPRVAGTHLNVSVKEIAGLEVSAGSLSVQKASAASVYRQQYSVTRLAAAPADLRVLVTMDSAEGSAFGFFSIPLDGGISTQKQDSVKQR
ncbi:MAG: hypothetical protein ABI769_05090 [Pseudomonadota bacterium]